MQLLANRLVEVQLIEQIFDEAVRLPLKNWPQVLVKGAMVYQRSQC